VIPAGKTTALVGPSGAGKTTLVNLLMRLSQPTAGEILTDGETLDSFDLLSWRARLALVTQHPYIFNATIRENIAYGVKEASEEQIAQAATRANAYEFIAQLPQGFETRTGSRGLLLSDGQRQRIALARALVREPDILILDEATNAMDSIAESAVIDALRLSPKAMTIIVIAHRLSIVEHAENIVVLEQGEMREVGTLEQLREKDGLFARLYKQQTATLERK
jgi:ATP-binding cassette, subfamily B, bacterial MsbA